jgi:ubiquinone/menaquinone biosynthesis C-methylase UbiE
MFNKLAEHEDPSMRVGRTLVSKELEQNIFQHMVQDVSLKDLKLLEVGVGCGRFFKFWSELYDDASNNLTFIDDPHVLHVAQKQSKFTNATVTFVEGQYPSHNVLARLKRNYSYIVMYSVLHYMSDKLQTVTSLTKLLSNNGKMVIGDVPIIDLKYDLLNTTEGREFDTQYRIENQLPIPDYQLELKRLAKIINDPDQLTLSFVEQLERRVKDLGLHLEIRRQPAEFPFSKTRLDLHFAKY